MRDVEKLDVEMLRMEERLGRRLDSLEGELEGLRKLMRARAAYECAHQGHDWQFVPGTEGLRSAPMVECARPGCDEIGYEVPA